MLGAYDILAPIGLVIVQHFKRDELPREAGKLILVKQARYGDTVISIYKKET
jgi:16S rRNA G966 N2-methylase RsmD